MLQKSWGLVFLLWVLECLVPGGKWALIRCGKGHRRSKEHEFWPPLLIPNVAVQKTKKLGGDQGQELSRILNSKWWREVKGDGEALLSKVGDSWVRWLMEISFSCTLWNFILGETCVPALLHSWSLTCCEFQHRATLTYLSVRSNDPGKDIGIFAVLSSGPFRQGLLLIFIFENVKQFTCSLCVLHGEGGAKPWRWWP